MGINNKKTGIQHHQKLILHSSCHVQRALAVATKVEQGTLRIGNEWLLMITGDPFAKLVSQKETIFHHQWYMFLLHWTIKSSNHPICPRLVNSHPDIHRSLLVITCALIARKETKRAMSCHHQWYLCILHWMIKSLIHLSCPLFFNSHPDLHITRRTSCKLLQYPVGLHLILQIPCHCRPPIMEVAIFMDAWLMCLSWHHHNNNSLP